MVRAYAKGLEIDSDAMEKFLNNILTRETRKYISVGEEAMRQLRAESTNTWYGYNKNKSGTAMNEAMECNIKQSQNKGIITIDVTSYINPRKLEQLKMRKKDKARYSPPYNKLLRWREKHEVPYTYNKITHPALYMGYSIGQYIVHLQWENGDVALPKSSGESGTGWKNENYIGNEPMKEYVESYVNKNWTKRVTELYEKKKKKMKG